MVAGEMAAKHGDLQQVSGERGPLGARSGSGRVDPVERSDLGEGEHAIRRGGGCPGASDGSVRRRRDRAARHERSAEG